MKKRVAATLASIGACGLIMGANCGLGRTGECQTDRDCADDEECNDGACEPIRGGEGEGEPLCEGCCFDAASDCRASEVCRFSQADIDNGDPGACVDAEGIQYLVGLIDISLCERNTDGSEWDLGAGAPDPFMEIDVSGVPHQTTAVQDSFSPGALALELTLLSTDSVTVWLYDEDVTTNDPIGGYCAGPECDQAIGVDALRGLEVAVGDPSCTESAIASATLVVTPSSN